MIERRPPGLARCACVVGAVVVFCATGNAERRAAPQKAAGDFGDARPIHFEDITRAAGIHFVHYNGAFGKKWLPETLGPGVAFIDYDNDGCQDILL